MQGSYIPYNSLWSHRYLHNRGRFGTHNDNGGSHGISSGCRSPVEDLSILTTAPTLSTSMARWISPSAASDLDCSNTASGMSTGAKVGVGVAAGIGSIFLVTLMAVIWAVRRRKRHGNRKNESEHHEAELPGIERRCTELDDGTVKYEAQETGIPHRADDTVKVELEGEWRGWEAPTEGTSFNLVKTREDAEAEAHETIDYIDRSNPVRGRGFKRD